MEQAKEPRCGHVDTWMFDQLEVLGFDGHDGEDEKVFRRLLDGNLCWEKVIDDILYDVSLKEELRPGLADAIREATRKYIDVSGIIVKCEVCGQTFCIST